MRYLCDHHRERLLQAPAIAMNLWQQAIVRGKHSHLAGDLGAAKAFFGSAFEIAYIHRQLDPDHSNPFASEHLATAGLLLADILMASRCGREAEDCLRLAVDNCYHRAWCGDFSAESADALHWAGQLCTYLNEQMGRCSRGKSGGQGSQRQH